MNTQIVYMLLFWLSGLLLLTTGAGASTMDTRPAGNVSFTSISEIHGRDKCDEPRLDVRVLNADQNSQYADHSICFNGEFAVRLTREVGIAPLTVTYSINGPDGFETIHEEFAMTNVVSCTFNLADCPQPAGIYTFTMDGLIDSKSCEATPESLDSYTFTIEVFEKFVASISEEQTICYNTAPDELTSEVSGGEGTYTHQWQQFDSTDWNNIADATSATYQPPDLTETTEFRLVVNDPCGTIETHPVTITVYEEFVASISEEQTICYNTAPDELTSEVSGGEGTYTYQWRFSEKDNGNWTEWEVITGAEAVTYQPGDLIITTRYKLVVTDDANCGPATTDPVTITVNDLPEVTLDTLDDVCYDAQPFALTGGLPPGGEYTGPGVDDQGWFDPLDAGDGTHEITYTYTDANGCTDSATADITVYPLPDVTLEDFDDVCLNMSAFELSGGLPDGGEYHGTGVDDQGWFDPQDAGEGTHEITYTFTDDNGCSEFKKAYITVHPQPSAHLTVNNATVCQHDHNPQITFTGSNGTPPYKFFYRINEGDELPVTTDNQTYVFDHNTDASGVFIYELFKVEDNYCASSLSESVTLQIAESPERKPIHVKSVDGVPLVLIYPLEGFNYQWYKDDHPIAGATEQYYLLTAEDKTNHATFKVYLKNKEPEFGLYCSVYSEEWDNGSFLDEGEAFEDLFVVYPNPASDQIHIVLNEAIDENDLEEAEFVLYNKVGQQVLKQKINHTTTTLLLPVSGSKLYFLLVRINDELRQTKQIIVNQ